MSRVSLETLRRYAVERSLFAPTTLQRALERLQFVQADPIRAPARAQDLTLRQRVRNYKAGDLDRHYAALELCEDFFVNYGFVTRTVHELMHPRAGVTAWSSMRWSAARRRLVDALLAFVRERGTVHPREVDAHFAHGSVVNYWGGSSSATTRLLDQMHYRGLLRVCGRDAGTRLYAVRESAAQDRPKLDVEARRARMDALVDVVIGVYAPLPARNLSVVVRRLRYGVPQWRSDLTAALRRARDRLGHARIGKVDWYWPAAEQVSPGEPEKRVRLLAPFDPLVWDRARFETFWGWAYRFEAYTPAKKRKLGYYALPLLWRDDVVGWGNLTVRQGDLHAAIGYVKGRPPRERAFRAALEEEIARMRDFLGLKGSAVFSSPGADAGSARGTAARR